MSKEHPKCGAEMKSTYRMFEDERTFLTKEELNRHPVEWLQDYKKELDKKMEKMSNTSRSSLSRLLRQRNRILGALERKDVM